LLERDDIRACPESARRLVGHGRIEPFFIEVGAYRSLSTPAFRLLPEISSSRPATTAASPPNETAIQGMRKSSHMPTGRGEFLSPSTRNSTSWRLFAGSSARGPCVSWVSARAGRVRSAQKFSRGTVQGSRPVRLSLQGCLEQEFGQWGNTAAAK
jgi:hypothetical protein